MSIDHLRKRAIAAFDAGVAAADPAQALNRAIARAPFAPLTSGEFIIISIGKAACKMAKCAIEQLPEGAQFSAVAVTNYENEVVVPGCRVMCAGHPVPDENGYNAAQFVIAELDRATAEDFVVVCVSGGSSALMPAPVPGLAFADKVGLNDLLLASGLDITQMNLIRQSLSDLKGGGMLRHAAPAQLRSYILSDVVGDDLRVVGSGPTTPPIGSPALARALMKETGLYTQAAQSVRDHLDCADATLVELPSHTPELIGGNTISAQAMAKAAEAALDPLPLAGLVDVAAQRVVAAVHNAPKGEPIALAFGGETTVKLTGSGKGGRNQELSVRVAQLLEENPIDRDWCFLSGGTDGRDGPTDAAGGLVDGATLKRAKTAGADVTALLANNDSYAALGAADDLLMTGATGTNVADLQLFLSD